MRAYAKAISADGVIVTSPTFHGPNCCLQVKAWLFDNHFDCNSSYLIMLKNDNGSYDLYEGYNYEEILEDQ